MNCDAIASAYRWIEYAAFGRQLERHRLIFLDEARDRDRALLVGDGDGRFLIRLAIHNPRIKIDCIELSGKMIDVAQKRLYDANVRHCSRIRLIKADIRHFELAPEAYDLVVTNFLLDCFSAVDLAELVLALRRSCTSRAKWLIAEFQKPSYGWRAWHARLWLRSMYLFFGLTTRLKTQSLPPYEKILAQTGFSLTSKATSRAGLICSELWSLTR